MFGTDLLFQAISNGEYEKAIGIFSIIAITFFLFYLLTRL
jgi:hypothetical protein